MTLAVLCPGQGGQHPALLDFVDRFPDSVRVVEAATEALGENPRTWLTQGDEIYRNAIAQPLIALAQLAQWAALRNVLPTPLALAGYSVGELSCYGIAGALGAGALARLARARADAMDAAAEKNPGGLMGVHGVPRAALAGICESMRAYIAIAIADDVDVVGGDETALARVREHCENIGAKVTELRVGIASHTPLLAAAADTFRGVLGLSALGVPTIPIMAGIDASLIATRARAIETLSEQISHTLEWGHCLDALYERGCRVYLELAPGRALSKMVRDRFGDVEARSVDEFGQLENVSDWVRRRVR